MKNLFRALFGLFRQTFQDWNADHAPRLAAALAYYTAFSLAPLLVIAIAIAGALLGQQQVETQVTSLIGRTISPDAATFVEGMIVSASQPKEGLIATVLGLATLLLGAMGAFGQLQAALDVIWDVDEGPKRASGILPFIRGNLLNFGMVLMIGFMLLISLVISTALAGVGTFIGRYVEAESALQLINLVISLGVITVLFALIFKVLPHADVRWRDVWIGAVFTSLMFSVGRLVLSIYLANSGTQSAYGAAGAFVLILLWVYYSAQILLFGAEFTQVFSSRYGTRAQTAGAPGSVPFERAIVPVSPVMDRTPAGPRPSRASTLVFSAGLLAVMVLTWLVGGRRSA